MAPTPREELADRVDDLLDEWGYGSRNEFVKDTVWQHILRLKSSGED